MTKTNILRLALNLAVLSTLLVGCTISAKRGAIQPDPYQETIRVACVGDSVTYGAGIEDRQRYNYPRQLARMLGDKWEVRNFGVNGTTLLKNGGKPYVDEQAFQNVLEFNPHVVVIGLGGNDSKPQNWRFKDEFVADYQSMIDHFEALPSAPRIWICLPAPAYPERWGISDERIREEVIPRVKEVARQAHVPVIDFYRPLSGKSELFPDRIHPNAEGAGLIAGQVYMALTGKDASPSPAKVLIIGDSISIGYFEPAKALLSEQADVHHNSGNAQHTAYGLAKLGEWLGPTQWDVIHFNHGLHDLKYADARGKLVALTEGKQQIPIDQYARNLEKLTLRLKKTGASVIFATTTPVPEGATGRVKGDPDRYNEAAREVMARHGVRVNDLYAFALPRLESIQQPHNVHFTEEGSRLLAEEVANGILEALEK